NLDIGDALRAKVESRVAGALAKYFDGSYTGHVTVARDGTGYRTDCVLHLTSGITLEASGSAHDAHASFEQTAERIEKRLRRYKKRLKGRSGAAEAPSDGAAVAYAVLESPDEDDIEEADYHPAVIAETTRPLASLSVPEAVLELDMTGSPALVFRHAG